jgi:hypothetical protein
LKHISLSIINQRKTFFICYNCCWFFFEGQRNCGYWSFVCKLSLSFERGTNFIVDFSLSRTSLRLSQFSLLTCCGFWKLYDMRILFAGVHWANLYKNCWRKIES